MVNLLPLSACAQKRTFVVATPPSGYIVAVLENFRVQVLLTSKRAESLAGSAAIEALDGRIRGVWMDIADFVWLLRWYRGMCGAGGGGEKRKKGGCGCLFLVRLSSYGHDKLALLILDPLQGPVFRSFYMQICSVQWSFRS